ncbi:hypothetical protein SteCoe_26332 [Stentor coeruleus]|uniref:EF-hand domain-containing protein n=1 Tax=Stentor coeruleus TaxID=5963 RepID=A0A1R2BD80_9CILI|nr:hypothetical protein SteCoe_26332 [Stentor coeruleus]
MGCQESTVSTKIPLPLGAIEEVEKLLNLQLISSRKLDLLLHRYSYSNFIPEKNFLKVCDALSINYQVTKHFYSLLKITDNGNNKELIFCSRKLCTLGIIYGSSSELEKVRLLFQNYDIDTSKVLNTYEISKLVQDVVFIVLEAIPLFAMHLYPFDSEIMCFIQKFNMAKEYVQDIIVNMLMNDSSEITYAAFLKSFKSFQVRSLINPKDLRKFCEKIDQRLANMKDVSHSRTKSINIRDFQADLEGSKSKSIKKSTVSVS